MLYCCTGKPAGVRRLKLLLCAENRVEVGNKAPSALPRTGSLPRLISRHEGSGRWQLKPEDVRGPRLSGSFRFRTRFRAPLLADYMH